MGPYFFTKIQSEEAVSETVNGKRHLQLLMNYAISQLQNEHEGINNMIFIQDGATRHIYQPVIELLTALFQDHVISRHFTNSMPLRSPDLNPADYWLWGS